MKSLSNPARAAVFVSSAVLLAVIANGIIFYFGINSTASRNHATPPGWEWVGKIVAVVWVVLFAIMALGAWFAQRSEKPTGKTDAWLIWGFIIVCVLYPFYTFGFQAVPGLIANVIVLILSLGLCVLVSRSSFLASASLIPVILWISVATVYVAKLVHANPGKP